MKARLRKLLPWLALLLLACNLSSAPLATPPPPHSAPATAATAAPTPSQTPQPSSTATPTPTSTSTFTPTSTLTPTTPPTATATPIPTYITLRGKVTVEKAVCHYGPGAPYLYKYALIGGSNLEIIARLDGGDYLEVRAIGGNNPCWVNAQWMQVKGDLANVAPIRPEDVQLPPSPYYGPPSGVSAARKGNDVSIFWRPFPLRAGDDSGQFPFLVEAWLCQGGQIVFTPIGSYETALKVSDEAGCAAPSHGRLYAVEKHGYTRPVEIPWPAHATPTP